MTQEDIERLHFYQRQYLGAQDFEDQQAYHRDMRRRHNLAHHLWGIVTGMELKEVSQGDELDVYISPGMAVDGYGREIILLHPYKLDPGEFKAYRKKQYCSIWLEYSEEYVPGPGYEQCDNAGQLGRIRETYTVDIDTVVIEPGKGYHDDITVDGEVIKPSADPKTPFDENASVSYQQFPDETSNTSSWRIPLGRVMWDGTKFLKSDSLYDGRRYIGGLLSEILTPSTELIIRDYKSSAPAPRETVDLPDSLVVTVQGELQVERLLTAKGELQVEGLLTAKNDVLIQGGMLDFCDDVCKKEDQHLFTLKRNTRKDGKDLQLQIGTEKGGNNHFVVSRGADTDQFAVFTVADNGFAHLEGPLELVQDLRMRGGVIDFDNQMTIASIVPTDGRKPDSGNDLQLQLGEEKDGSSRFLVSKGKDTDKEKGKVALFTVDYDGNASVKQNLTVGGTLNLPQGLTIGGPLDFGNQVTIARTEPNANGGDNLQLQIGTESNGKNNFVVGTSKTPLLTITDNGNTSLAGPLSLGHDLTVAGTLSLGQNLTVSGPVDLAQTLTVGGQANLKQNLSVGGEVDVVQKLSVNGQADLKQNLTVGGTLDLAQTLSVGGQADLKQNLIVAGAVNLGQSLTVGGEVDLKQNLKVGGPLDLAQNLTVGGSLNLGQNLTVGGSQDLKQNLTTEGTINFGSQVRQMLNLWSTNYAIGVQDSTLYYRSDGDFCWFRGGHHADSPSTAGDGGLMRMKLGSDGVLEVLGDRAFFVKLGYSTPQHGSDSIYSSPNLWLDTPGIVLIKEGYQSRAMDGAEFFAFSEPVTAGDVVVLSADGNRAVKPAESAYDASVAGVISTDPAFILGGAASTDEIEAVKQGRTPVALIGTVPCKVDADIAPIHRGDLLTTSPTKGHAQKVLDAAKATGTVLGKAMENLERGRGLIQILVMLT